MEASERSHATGSGAPGTETADDEVVVSVSDMHLSAGKVLQLRVKRTLRYRVARLAKSLWSDVDPPEVLEVPNPMEDFHFDEVFRRFLAAVIAAHGGARILRVMLMGDVFDPLAITWGGRFVDPPFEAVGAFKMRKIIRGHPVFFDALAELVRAPNARLDIFVGNHDQFLCWPKVQKEIVDRIARGDREVASRIRFVDQAMDFELVHRDVLYNHGMNSEPHNSIDPRTTILPDHFGKPLKRPVLNKPLGSHMTVTLANRLKVFNPLIGRMPKEWDIWLHAFKHKWLWGAYAGLMLAWVTIYNILFAMWDIRHKSGLITILRVVLATTRKNPVDVYAAKLLKQRRPRVVVLGHSHIARRVTGPDGTYINTGSWALTLRFVYPTFRYVWRRCRRLEVAWRTLLHFLRTGELAFARQLTKLVGFVALATAMAVFLVVVSPGRGAGFQLVDLKMPVAIGLTFVVLAGLFRVFAVKPQVVDATQFPFALVRHGKDGSLSADLMQFDPRDGSMREYV